MRKHMEFAGLIKELVTLFQVHTYMEIGVQEAITFNQIAPLVKRAVAVDINPIPAIKLKHVETHVMPSLEFAKQWKDPIDLLFIDANHKHTSVMADLDAFLPFVRLHKGLILLHDTYPTQAFLEDPYYCDDAWKAAHFIHKTNYCNLEIVTLPGPWAGLSILRKIDDRHLDWKEEPANVKDQTIVSQEQCAESSGESGESYRGELPKNPRNKRIYKAAQGISDVGKLSD